MRQTSAPGTSLGWTKEGCRCWACCLPRDRRVMVTWLWGLWASKRAGGRAVLTAHGRVDQALPLIQAALLLAAGQGAGVVQRRHLAHLQWQSGRPGIQAGRFRVLSDKHRPCLLLHLQFTHRCCCCCCCPSTTALPALPGLPPASARPLTG